MSFLSIFNRFVGLRSSKLLQHSICSPNILNEETCRRRVSSRQAKRKRRFTMPPFWLPRQHRVKYPEALTKSNVEFIEKVTEAQYETPLNLDVYKKPVYKRGSFRCGIIATKIGTQPMWMRNGKKNLLTLLHISDNHVIKIIDSETTRNNFNMRRYKNRFRKLSTIIIGSDSMNPQLTTSQYYKFFEKSGVMPKKRLTKFLISEDAILPPGTPLYAGHYRPNDRIDIIATTVDRGFQGGMKRHGFHGQAFRGNTKSHRRIGSIGSNRTKIWPGKKMPGHMGRNKRIHRGIKIIRIDTKHDVIYVLGTMAGEVGSYCVLCDSLLYPYRRNTKNNIPPFFPTYMPEYGDEPLPEEMLAPEWKPFDEAPIAFEIVVEKSKRRK